MKFEIQGDTGTNSDVTDLFNVERFAQNADLDTGTYTFTAPVTGKYQLTVNLELSELDSAAAFYQEKLVTSNRSYASTVDPD